MIFVPARYQIVIGGIFMIGDDSQKNKFPSGLSDVTQTVSAQENEETLNPAEQIVAFEWKPGDVIFDLYEVRKVSEGFGEETTEKDYYEGGFGRVYKVWHRGWNMELAVKVPRLEAYNTPAKKDNFIRECETWISLGLHPHVATCNYVRDLGGIPCIFSEYATAGTLEDWIGTGRLYDGGEKVALKRILDIAIQFAWGLHHAHEHEGGVIHQDVKPLNLLMMEEGTAKVSDFGLAKARALPDGGGTFGVDDDRHSMLVTSGGGYTPVYCSPEQLTGQPLSRRTDIWSWGLSILAMFQGGATWVQSGVPTGQLAAEILETYLEDNNRTAHEESEILEGIPLIPEGVIVLLRQCFQADPNTRPKTMLECADRLIEVYRAVSGNDYPRYTPKAAELLADDLNNRALSFLDLGKPDKAERLFDEALRRHPDHVLATYNRGLMLWRSAKTTDDKVLESLRACEQSEPENPMVSLCRGWVEWERGNFEIASYTFREYREIGGTIETREALDRINTQGFTSSKLGREKRIKANNYKVLSCCFSADGCFALSGGGSKYHFKDMDDDNAVKLWDIRKGQCLHSFEGHTAGVTSVCLSIDAQGALSGSMDRTIRIWSVRKGQCIRTLKGHLAEVLTVSAHGQVALSGSKDKTAKLWDLRTGNCIYTFEGHTESVSSVCLETNGQHALTASQDTTVKLWDINSGKCIRTFEGHASGINTISMTNSGLSVVSGSEDTTVKMWDIQKGTLISTFSGHTGAVTSVRISSNDRYILSGDKNGEVRLWDVASGRCLRTLEERYSSEINSLDISMDERWILIGKGQCLNLWDITRLTHDKWQKSVYLHSRVATALEAYKRHEEINAVIQETNKLLESNHPELVVCSRNNIAILKD